MKKQSRDTRKVTSLGKGADRRIDLSGCKLVVPYGRDPHALESLSAIATKMGATKPGLKSTASKTKQLRSGSSKADAKLEKSSKRCIDLSNCALVAPYGQDPHALESLSAIATKIGVTKTGLKSIARKA
jgi:hypothetical protein